MAREARDELRSVITQKFRGAAMLITGYPAVLMAQEVLAVVREQGK